LADVADRRVCVCLTLLRLLAHMGEPFWLSSDGKVSKRSDLWVILYQVFIPDNLASRCRRRSPTKPLIVRSKPVRSAGATGWSTSEVRRKQCCAISVFYSL
ncbi:hypothetical protein E2562_032345, partial [Oryza meyeriana var. granulata]